MEWYKHGRFNGVGWTLDACQQHGLVTAGDRFRGRHCRVARLFPEEAFARYRQAAEFSQARQAVGRGSVQRAVCVRGANGGALIGGKVTVISARRRHVENSRVVG